MHTLYHLEDKILQFNYVLDSHVVECSMESFKTTISEVNFYAFIYRLFYNKHDINTQPMYNSHIVCKYIYIYMKIV